MRAVLSILLLVLSVVAAQADTVVLRRGNVAEPDTLDPQKATTDYASHILLDLFTGLTAFDADAQIVPGIAESWKITPDGKTYTFKLRPNLVWSDGMPLTADDAVAGIRRALDPKTASQQAVLAFNIKNAVAVNGGKMTMDKLGVRAIDNATVEIVLEQPSMTLLLTLAENVLSPIPRHVVAKYGDDWVKPGNMVSNGPYTLAEWRSNDRVRLIKNPRFFEANQVKIDEVLYYPTDDDAGALKRFRAGEIDMNGRFSPSDLAWLKANMPAAARTSTASWFTYLVVNQTNPKFKDVRVRRALALAIDREAITDKLIKTGEVPAYGVVPSAIKGYTGSAMDFRNLPMDARKAEARKLLAEAGYTAANPLTFALRQRSGTSNRRISVAIMTMMKEIGVKVDLIQSEVKTHYDALRSKDFEVADVGEAWPADPEYFIADLTSNSENNFGGYASAEYDRIANEAKGMLDPAKRFARFADAEALAARDIAVIPLFYNVNTNLVAPYVKGFKDNPRDYHVTRYLSIVR